MKLKFITPFRKEPGAIASLLNRSYAELLSEKPLHWKPEQANWERYDQEVYSQPDTIGACIFLSRLDSLIIGFGSWDPRQRPHCGLVGHNCILPEFRGKGYGKQQIQEILRRLRRLGIKRAKATTNDDRFFVPAQRMYTACGFREIRRIPWERDPKQMIIEYEKIIGK